VGERRGYRKVVGQGLVSRYHRVTGKIAFFMPLLEYFGKFAKKSSDKCRSQHEFLVFSWNNFLPLEKHIFIPGRKKEFPLTIRISLIIRSAAWHNTYRHSRRFSEESTSFWRNPR